MAAAEGGATVHQFGSIFLGQRGGVVRAASPAKVCKIGSYMKIVQLKFISCSTERRAKAS